MIGRSSCRRHAWVVAWSLLLHLVGFMLPARAAESPARRPNVVVLVADDLGYADLGCYGSRDIPTPHIDALAQSGVRCTQAYVTAGTCSPSRAGFMTGRYQQRRGFEFNCNARPAAPAAQGGRS